MIVLLVLWLAGAGSLVAAELATTRVVIRPLSGAGVPQPSTYDHAYPSFSGGFNVALTYEIGSDDFLFLLNSASGQAGVFRLDAAGGAPELVQAPRFRPGLRAAATYRQGGPRRLVLLDPVGGALYAYDVDTAGVVDPSESEPVAVLTALKRIHLFDSAAVSGGRVLFGLDTWSGDAASFDTNGWHKIKSQQHSVGWTDLDHMKVDGRTYRLLYKELGDPFDPESAAGPQGGRLAVVEVGSDGFTLDEIIDRKGRPGWTTVRFIRYSGHRGIYFYRRGDGRLRLLRFAGQHPSAEDGIVKSTDIEPGFDQLLSYRVGSQAFLVGVTTNTQNSERLTAVQLARLAQCVHDNAKDGVVGYQLAIMQSGDVVLNRAWGKRKASPAKPLKTSTRIALGSVSKVYTTVTGLRASEEDIIDLVQPIAGQIDDDLYPPASLADWVFERTPLDLMAQTSGVYGGDCDGSDELTTDCSAFFGAEADEGACDEDPPDGRFPCRRKYRNEHFAGLRVVLEGRTGLETTPEIDELAQDLWLKKIFPITGPSCLAMSGSWEHGACGEDDDDCVTWNGREWRQTPPGKRVDGWAKSCSAGGWTASARQNVEMLQALRYGQILGSHNTDRILDVELQDKDGNPTALGFEPPWQAGDHVLLGKNGKPSRSTGTFSYITTLPHEADGSLLYNTKGTGVTDPTKLLRKAYRSAVGIPGSSCPQP